MIADKTANYLRIFRFTSSKMLVFTASFFMLVSSLPAQYNMTDDLALVDAMLKLKAQGFQLDKELDIHLRLLKDRYPASINTIQAGKIAYSQGSKAKARGLFIKVPKNDENFREMVFTYFKYADDIGDSTGRNESTTLYFESTLKETLPQQGTDRWSSLMEMKDLYGTITRKDEDDPKLLRFKALQEWAKKNGLEIVQPPPGDELVKANNHAEKIILKDPGVEKDAKVDTETLKKWVKKHIESEWDKRDYWFFKGIAERARGQILLGDIETGLKTISDFSNDLVATNDELFAAIDADENVPKNDKEKIKKASDLIAGVRYTKGIAKLLLAIKAKNQGQMDQAKELLRGRTGAAAQFGLCIFKNKGSKEAYRSILRYDKCRDLDKEWFPNEGRLKALTGKPFNVKGIDLGKAYYNLEMFDKAISYFDKYKDAKINEESYEAVYYSLWANVEAGSFDKADEYLDLLGGKFYKLNKKPKDYFTQSCLRLSGKYRTMKNEAEDEEKKKEYADKQLYYFKKSVSITSSADPSIVFTLAYKDFKKCFEYKKNGEIEKAKEMYPVAVKAFESITQRFPTSSEAVKSYKQLGLLHEYFRKLDTAKAMYEEYLKRIATPDVKGRVDKLDALTSIANVDFLGSNYQASLETVAKVDAYLESESFDTKDEGLLKRMAGLKEKRETLRIFSSDNLTTPKKKERRLLKTEMDNNPEDEDLKVRYEALTKEINEDLRNTVDSFKKWLRLFPESANVPSVMARLGSLYQELDNQGDARKIYDDLKQRFPDHEVVKMISINIVNAHLKNEDYAAAVEALQQTDFKELNSDSIKYLINQFYFEEALRGMSGQVLRACSKEVVTLIDIVRPKEEEAGKSLNQLHFFDYRKARALFHMSQYDEAKEILEKMAKDKPYGPYIFRVKFLLGAIAAKENDYKKVSRIYAGLTSLIGQLEKPDKNTIVRISVEWASAYEETDDETLIKKGRGMSMVAKETNMEQLSSEGIDQVQKAAYLFILYSKKLGAEREKIDELKKDYLNKYPAAKWSSKVRKL